VLGLIGGSTHQSKPVTGPTGRDLSAKNENSFTILKTKTLKLFVNLSFYLKKNRKND
jgi:hypothetical protein